ncbi:MAG: polymerase sigma factor, partial [Frankiales bacterium]|nr:polymerase sigma factor [Frankiales bacterium]
MSAPARPVDVVEALVERSRSEGRLSLDQLRTAFDAAGIGPAEAGAVLRRLTEAGAVLDAEEPKRPRRTAKPAARPAARPAAKQTTRPSGRTVAA